MHSLVKNELKWQTELLSTCFSACSERREEDNPAVREAILKITIHILENMNQTDLIKTLQKGKI